MNRFVNEIARYLRNSNSTLLYPQPFLALKFRKLIFFLSQLIYKYWMRRRRSSESILLDNIDRSILMRVDVSKAMGAAFYWMGYHEFKEWSYLNRILTPEMVFLDIGANQGEYSLFAAKRLKSGRVIAFEPMSFFYHQLNENIDLNKFRNIEVLNCGLSDRTGAVPIYMGEENSIGEHEGLATIFPTKERARFVEEIKLKVFDDITELLKIIRIDVVKIDVEGAELSVLKGMAKALKKFRPIVLIEMNDITFKAAGYDSPSILEFFKTINYLPFQVGRNGNLQIKSKESLVYNAVFAPGVS
jgi:FkbM family methyltransferase